MSEHVGCADMGDATAEIEASATAQQQRSRLARANRRFCPLATDSAAGVTRATVKHLAGLSGMEENQVIGRAMHDLAARLLPRYEADDGPPAGGQMSEIEKAVPQGTRLDHGTMENRLQD